MDIDLEQKDKVNQFLFIDETEHENLSQISGNLSTVYSLNKSSGAVQKIELKQLFSSSKNELKQLISGLLNENVKKIQQEIFDYIESSIKLGITKILNDLVILTLKNVSILPTECKVGEIFCLEKNDKKEYYICLVENKLQRILTDVDISYFQENYHDKNEVNDIINELNSQFSEKLNELNDLISNTLTKDDYSDLSLAYQEKIDELSSLISGFFN